MRPRLTILSLLLCLAPIAGSGCAVHQPRGQGEYQRIREPRTGAIYHLYLPVDYVRNKGRHPNYPKVKRWPLVMTFHGMKPYDNAIPQEREWEQEADIYGYIVCAPELRTCDSFMEYPLTKEHSYVKKDHERVLAIMDHVFVKTMADRKRVLSTSWSCGGYLAHFFPNRHPDRFSCIATRLSNFSAKLMRENTSPAYKRTPVAIFIGDGDFPACKNESEQAVAWYRARGFKVRGKMIDSMGHRRIPQTAAAFFAEQLGIQPLHPLDASKTVAKVHMTDFHPSPKLLAAMSPPSIVETALARRGKSKTKIRPPPTGARAVHHQTIRIHIREHQRRSGLSVSGRSHITIPIHIPRAIRPEMRMDQSLLLPARIRHALPRHNPERRAIGLIRSPRRAPSADPCRTGRRKHRPLEKREKISVGMQKRLLQKRCEPGRKPGHRLKRIRRFSAAPSPPPANEQTIRSHAIIGSRARRNRVRSPRRMQARGGTICGMAKRPGAAKEQGDESPRPLKPR